MCTASSYFKRYVMIFNQILNRGLRALARLTKPCNEPKLFVTLPLRVQCGGATPRGRYRPQRGRRGEHVVAVARRVDADHRLVHAELLLRGGADRRAGHAQLVRGVLHLVGGTSCSAANRWAP